MKLENNNFNYLEKNLPDFINTSIINFNKEKKKNS